MGKDDLISRAALIAEFEWLKQNTGAYNHPAIDENIERIRRAPAVDVGPAWISVDERLPERGEVIVCCPDPDRPVQFAYSNGCIFRNAHGRPIGLPVTHWMPLPNPPIMDADIVNDTEE